MATRGLGLAAALAAAMAGPWLLHGTRGVEATGFSYRGRPIHPKLVEEFEGWLSDARGPVTVAVDVAAAWDTNEYDDPVAVNAFGFVKYRNPAGWYGYRHLGRMDDGTHVLYTASYGGGSGIFETLLFLRLEQDEAITPEGRRYQRLIMSAKGRFDRGGLDGGAGVEVLGDRVLVAPGRDRPEPVVLDFGG